MLTILGKAAPVIRRAFTTASRPAAAIRRQCAFALHTQSGTAVHTYRARPTVQDVSRRSQIVRSASTAGEAAPAAVEMVEKLKEDTKTYMKARDQARLNSVRFLSSAIKNREIELKGEGKQLTQQEAMAVAQKLIKQTKQAIDEFKAAGRSELAEQEQAKVTVWEAYLPAQMSRADVDAVVDAVLAELQLSGPKAMGAVMKAVTARTKGVADSKMVSEAVKAKLNP